jgi:chemotaxis protein histidine kinase CheA
MAVDALETRYLLVEVNHQSFAISMHEVLAIHLLESPASADSLPVEQSEETLPAVDLPYLLGQPTQLSPSIYAVVLATQTYLCAVTVNEVRPVCTVSPDDRMALPPFITQLELPFSGIIHRSGSLILILDVSALMQFIRHLSPDLVRERVNAA